MSINATTGHGAFLRGLSVSLLLAVLAAASVIAQSTHAKLPEPFATPSATKFAKVVGWPAGKMPTAPTGFAVDALASDLESPRWLYVLPNDDILIAQSRTTKADDADEATREGLRQAGSLGPSPDQITLLRDADHDGRFETRRVFISGLNQPYGMAVWNGFLYVANSDALLRFHYNDGDDVITAHPEKILDLPSEGHHWARNIVFSPDGRKLYIGVGSQTNVDEEGIDAKDPKRAAILECNPDGSDLRIFASGMRNPSGMGWVGNTLWTVVNERDMLGDDLPSDYLTSVKDGGFYGWPYSYLGKNIDPRPKNTRPDLVAKAIVPDVLVGAHTASLGLLFYSGSSFPGHYRGGAFIGQHGSWNRSKFSGYQVGFVPFENGRPYGPIEDFLTGFVASEERSEVYGRPVGLAMLHDGSLIVADDAGKHIWRVRAVSIDTHE